MCVHKRPKEVVMIDAKSYSPLDVEKAYDRRSYIYSKVISPLENHYHQVAIKEAQVQPGQKILEVGTGPGSTFVELAGRVGADEVIHGVDISAKMLKLTANRMERKGMGSFELQKADCRELPFPDSTFDMLYSAYLLDLIPQAEIPLVLAEFQRVLVPGGRLVLLNMSTAENGWDWRESLYRWMPLQVSL